MILYLILSMAPLGCGALYLIHSAERKRGAQAVSIGVLLLLAVAVSSVLVWEYLAMP